MILVLGLSAQACLLGRHLYLSDDSPIEDELTANPVDADGGVGSGSGSGSGGSVKSADAAPSPSTPDSGKPDGTAPDGAPPKPDPQAMCAGGTAVEVEPNGTIDVARPLVIGKTCGALALGDADWFTMDIPPNGLLRVSFEADGDARLLMQSAGGGIAFATGTGGSFNFTTSGRYNLRVLSDTGRVQNYALVRPAP